MAWNRPTESVDTNSRPLQTRSRVRILLMCLGGVCLALCAAIVTWWFRPTSANSADENNSHQIKRQIAAVTPARVHTPKVAAVTQSATNATKEPVKFKPPKVPPGLSEEERDVFLRRAKYEWRQKNDPVLKKHFEERAKRESVFKSGTEQVIDWIFTSKVGDDLPPPLPDLSDVSTERLMEILDSVNEPKEEDSPEIVERKQIVDEVKKELKDWVAAGGNAQAFLEHYRNELVKAWNVKATVSAEIDKSISEGDEAATSIKIVEQGNKILEQHGIPQIDLTDDQKEAISDRLSQEDNK